MSSSINTSWTNVLEDSLTNLSLEKRRQIRMQQADMRIATLKSIHLELNDLVPYDRIVQLLKNTKVVEQISIICSDAWQQINVDSVFQVINSMSNLKVIELDIITDDPMAILSQTPLINLTSLQIVIGPNINYSFERIENVIKGYSKLNSLSLIVNDSSESQAKESTSYFNKVMTWLNPKWLQVHSLSLNFSGSVGLSDQQMKCFGKKVSSITSVNRLSICLNSIKISLDGCEEFLFQLSRSKQQLKELTLGMYCCPQKRTMKIIGKLFKHQLGLESLEIIDFMFREDQLKTFLNHQKVLKELKNLSYDIERNNIRNDGLIQIGKFLVYSKIPLINLKILFDYSVFSGKSILEFGQALTKIHSLKDLRLQFTGKIKDCSIMEFAVNISQTSKYLSYLFLHFSGSGDNNIVEFRSDQPDKSILENKSIDVDWSYIKYGETYVTGQYHYLIINTTLLINMLNLQHVSFKYPRLFKCPPEHKQQIENNIQQFVSNKNDLKSLKYISNYYSPAGFTQEMLKLIERNVSTIIWLELNIQIPKLLFNIISERAGVNLLKLKFANSKEFSDENIMKHLKEFPFLIELDISEGYVISQAFKFDFQNSLVFSDLISFKKTISPYYYSHLNNKQRQLSEKQSQIDQECLSMRKNLILMLTVFSREIFNHLTFKPQYMIIDLWFDL